MAHGSRNAETAVTHRQMCESLTSLTGISTTPAFLEINEPSIPEAIDNVAESHPGADIRILPLFLHEGTHVSTHIPELVSDAAKAHPDNALLLERHLGAHVDLLEMLAKVISQ